MRPLPMDAPGEDNDLNEKINHYVQRAMADETATLYAFGERWGPEPLKDKIFGFKPNQGIHDIHMNQGNPRDGQFAGDNGVWQDGGLMVHFPGQQQWVGVFLKFQSQALHTDDQTGHPITPPVPIDPGEPPVQPPPENPDWGARIVAALVNDAQSPEVETVTLLNPSPRPLDLSGWSLADKNKKRQALSGVIPPATRCGSASSSPWSSPTRAASSPCSTRPDSRCTGWPTPSRRRSSRAGPSCSIAETRGRLARAHRGPLGRAAKHARAAGGSGGRAGGARAVTRRLARSGRARGPWSPGVLRRRRCVKARRDGGGFRPRRGSSAPGRPRTGSPPAW